LEIKTQNFFAAGYLQGNRKLWGLGNKKEVVLVAIGSCPHLKECFYQDRVIVYSRTELKFANKLIRSRGVLKTL